MAHEILGVSARFRDLDAIVAAAHAARAAGYAIDAFTPFPVRALERLAARPDPSIPWATFLAALVGVVFGLWLGWYINVIDYPINVGGRPLASWPAFVLPAFELAVLFSTFGAIGTMLVRNRLPRLHHPIFEVPGFSRVSDDSFVLLIETATDGEPARRLLADRGGLDIAEVAR
ncbi:MAG: DUF3341 domain-containing protein [Solirubrobacterales bacterium]